MSVTIVIPHEIANKEMIDRILNDYRIDTITISEICKEYDYIEKYCQKNNIKMIAIKLPNNWKNIMKDKNNFLKLLRDHFRKSIKENNDIIIIDKRSTYGCNQYATIGIEEGKMCYIHYY